jgi:LmbE family N-acetylglucosaminyl deacetylase
VDEVTPPPDLGRACVVVAHPDDEALWFSSLLGRVGQVLLCFEACDEYPELAPGRQAVLDAYPLPGVRSLRLPEPCSVHLVDWSRAEPDAYGVALNLVAADDPRRERYRQSFAALRTALAPQLRGFASVFTHNAWGEYGHPDHIQVLRAVESLQPELGFRLFSSGYVAHRTMPLAARALPRIARWFELPTRPELVAPLEALYRAHGCWTWPTDYQRFATETFLEACTENDAPSPAPGSGFRLNCVAA